MLQTIVVAALIVVGAAPVAAQMPDSTAARVSPRTHPTATIPT